MSQNETIRARIRVAVWPNGKWTAYGDERKHRRVEDFHCDLIEAAPDDYSIMWVEVDLPVQAVLVGSVSHE